MKYLTNKNTWTTNPRMARKLDRIPALDRLDSRLAVFRFEGKYIIGESPNKESPNKLVSNPLNYEEMFESKKFKLRCESTGISTNKARLLIMSTPRPTLDVKQKELAIVWLASKFISGNINPEDMGNDSKITEYLDNFFKYKNKLEVKDLNKYDYPSQVFTALIPFVGLSEKSKVFPSKVANAKLVAKDKYGEIWTPLTVEASCELGKDTEWCTAKYSPDDERNQFDNYNEDGPLYIWFDKETGRRFQTHKSSPTMNEEDGEENNINFSWLMFSSGITNNLYLEGTQIKELPENLKVGGNLNLQGTQIKELPENLKVGGDLYLEGTQIEELPENLTVGGSFHLQGTQIKELPENLTVGGDLNLAGTQIKELPENLTVGGSLNLRGTQIKELPENLKVGGSLHLQGTQIEELPENLTVDGDLYLQGPQIKELPENLTVGGSLNLRGTQIKELPENLTVGGSLYLEGTQIEELPENLTVGSSLYLEGTQIEELPENLTVGGSLHLQGTQIEELPENLTVGGSLHLQGTQIKELPENLTVGGKIFR